VEWHGDRSLQGILAHSNFWIPLDVTEVQLDQGFSEQGERQVNSYQHAAQASVFRDSLAGASCLYLGKFSSAARPK